PPTTAPTAAPAPALPLNEPIANPESAPIPAPLTAPSVALLQPWDTSSGSDNVPASASDMTPRERNDPDDDRDDDERMADSPWKMNTDFAPPHEFEVNPARLGQSIGLWSKHPTQPDSALGRRRPFKCPSQLLVLVFRERGLKYLGLSHECFEAFKD